MFTIYQAETPDDLRDARLLFREYAASLDFELCFQGFEEELAGLPGPYAPPEGALLLARAGDELAGCVAFRPLEGDTCEMKRLYVRPAFRGQGGGRQLAEALVESARARGYQRMRLDTVASMTTARSLYHSMGFRETEAYYHNPLDEVVYLEKALP